MTAYSNQPSLAVHNGSTINHAPWVDMEIGGGVFVVVVDADVIGVVIFVKGTQPAQSLP